jgi:diguanylate cyclase (GGDEF)-like protein
MGVARMRARLVGHHDALLERTRWLFVLFNGLLAVLAFIETTYPDAPLWPRSGIMVAAFVGLGLWALAYFRAQGRGLVLELLPFGLLLAGALASGAAGWIFGRLYVALFLHALYGSGRRRLVLLTAGYALTYEVAGWLTGTSRGVAPFVATVLSVAVIAGIMQTLRTAVVRHERLRQRDAVLTDVTAALLGERDSARISQMVAEGALRLVGDGAIATVWRGDGDRLVRTGLAGQEDYPLGDAPLGVLPPELQAVYREGRTVQLGPDEMQVIQDVYGLPFEFPSAVVAPTLRDGAPSGLIVIGSRGELDDDLLGVVRRFANEISLAQELAEREQLLAGIVDNSSDVIAVIDSRGRLTFVSPAVRALTGREVDELVGCHLSTLLLDGDEPVGDGWTVPSRPTAFRLAGVDGEREVEVTASGVGASARVLNIRDVTERRRLEAEVAYRAYFDTVTGLPNRARFIDHLQQSIRRSRRSDRSVAVLLVDLDDFKGVNDGLGHAAGDALLGEVARRLGTVIRDADVAARLGGDEFALLLEDVRDAAEALSVADRLAEELRRPVTLDGRQVVLSASLGIVVSTDARHPDELLRDADVAMYAAKAAGKNQYALFEPQMHRRALARLEIRAELEDALLHDEMVLHYQPIVSMDSATVVGFEALLRWQHPQRGLVPPLDFVPVAEETGLIVPIGRWVLEEACRQLADWQAQRPDEPPLHVAVNLSPVQLRGRRIVEDVAATLAATGLEPSLLTLEVTETALIGEAADVGRVLRELKELGVRVAIDDFGTGYSSLSHLQQFPVDIVKVDRAFVSVVTDGVEQAALAEAIVKLARTLNMDTVAEGVEDPAHADILRDWGCGYGQGWLWSKALPADEVAALLECRPESDRPGGRPGGRQPVPATT